MTAPASHRQIALGPSARVARSVRVSQWCLAFFSAICLALHPGFVLKWNEGGFSNYGIHIKTAIPYSLAFFGCAVFSVRAGRDLVAMKLGAPTYAVILYVYAGLMVLTLVSTYGYTLNPGLKNAHTAVGIATMLFEPLAALWMYVRLRRTPWTNTLAVIELAGLILAVIDYLVILHVLFLAQVLTAFGFGALLVRTAGRLDEVRSREAYVISK
ncbi:MAG: hypothetical protein ACYC19_05345 [Acidimicrobiales bacterium]